MSNEYFKRHLQDLTRNAAETKARADESPEDWLLQTVAKNQLDAVNEAGRELAIYEAGVASEALEWRLVGQRLKFGEVPLSLLARIAEPLNKLILRAAYFARNRLEPQSGTGEDLANELDLRLVGVASGSARLFIRGNTFADMTGRSALSDGIENLFEALTATDDFSIFYERLGDLGEAAAHSLRETLKAIEQEECSLELRWHSFLEPKSWAATFDKVVQVRTLLDGTTDPIFRQAIVRGTVGLLAANGRLQVIDASSRKLTIRFSPKTQATQVGAFHLGQYVELSVTERAVIDPISGEELKRFTLNPPLSAIH